MCERDIPSKENPISVFANKFLTFNWTHDSRLQFEVLYFYNENCYDYVEHWELLLGRNREIVLNLYLDPIPTA